MKLVPIIVFLLFPVMLCASPDASDKGLQRDLNKVFKNAAFDLSALVVPEKIEVSGHFYKLSSSGFSGGYIYIGRVNTYRSASARNQPNSNSEFFDYYIQYDEELVVQKVRILRYQASHGQMVSAPGWLKQFAGYKPGRPLEVGIQVDAISGATISVNSITFDIRQKSTILHQMIRK